MAVENASTPDQLDPSLPLGTDFKSEGDNHIRLLKGVVQNTLQGLIGSATQAEAQNISTPGSNKIMTAIRVFEQVSARIATQTLAEGGTDDVRLMTSLRTKQYIDARLPNSTEAASGSNAVKLMTSLATKQYIDGRRATQAQAEGASNADVLLTPLRGGQLAQKNFNDNYTAKVATQTQSNDGTADNVTVTPLKARVTSDARYLRLAQTTAFTRSLLDDADAAAFRSTLGLGNSATSNRSTSITSTSTVNVATSSAVNAVRGLIPPDPAAGGTVIRRLVGSTAVGTTDTAYNNTTDFVTTDIGSHICVTVLLPGVITAYAEHQNSAGSTSHLRVLRNGSQVAAWSTSSSSFTARSVNISVSVGDVITFQARTQSFTALWRNVQIRANAATGAVA